ncbi:hypothetical protein BH11GEM2_BH11GEM2_38260 [soil metagenome]
MSSNDCSGSGGRGCACPWHVTRRVYARNYARGRRDAALAARQGGELRCVRRFGPDGLCGARLELITDGNGGTITAPCPKCERLRRGLCADCPARVEGKIGRARRCAACKHRANTESVARHVARNHDEILAAARRSYQENDDVRRRRNEYKRAYRKAHPDKVRAQKQRYVEKHRDDPRSGYRRYHARYRRKHSAYYRQLENERSAEARALRVIPVCRTCGKKTGWEPAASRLCRPWTKCMKCLFPCERKLRRRAIRERAKAIAADPNFVLPPKRVKVVKPRLVAERGPGHERLCVTEGCDIVVTHRRKKCTKCRRQEAELATAKIAEEHAGRGRRTDLERRSVA